jgi:sugar phosphate isomerase/epimerase
MNTRRTFLKTGSAALAASLVPTASLLSGNAASAAAPPAGPTEFCFFSKHLQGLSFDQIADIAAEVGVQGIEAPIRPGGHVEPERVEEDLPKLAEALKKRGLGITILTSGINAVNAEQHTEKVLRTAKALGVKHYRMDWFKYDLSKPIWPQLQSWRPQLKELVAFSKEVGIQPLYQNHSGKTNAGSPIWDMYSLIRDYAPAECAFAFDIMHATVEGSESWPLEVSLVRDYIGAAYFKNFTFGDGKHGTCPLADGVVTKDYVAMLKKFGWSGPCSLHIEYLKGKTKDPGYVDEAIKATKRDFATLKEWWA